MHILLISIMAALCSMVFANSGYVYTQELNSVYASRAIYVCSDKSVVVLGNSETKTGITIAMATGSANSLYQRL